MACGIHITHVHMHGIVVIKINKHYRTQSTQHTPLAHGVEAFGSTISVSVDVLIDGQQHTYYIFTKFSIMYIN